MTEQEVMARLQEPFDPSEIEWRVGSTNQDKTKGLALAYVTNRAIQNRLDEVFGCFGWQNTYKEWKGSSQLCGVSVWCEQRNEWVTKWDGADDSNQDPTKGGLSDAMKRAAYQWGIGRYLYKLDSLWVPIKPRGKSFVLESTPKLPAWATPKPSAANSPVGSAPKAPTKKAEPKVADGKAVWIAKITSVANGRNLTPEQVSAGCQKYFQTGDLAALSMDQMKELYDMLNVKAS